MKKIDNLKDYNDYMVNHRRDFHQNPEIGFQEFRTSKIIADELENFGIEVVKDFCETAVVGIIKTNKPGPIIGIRADMDALEMPDEKNVEYRSQNQGICHSCGHDGHTAILLGIAKYISANKNDLVGTIKLIFQPAEEGPFPGGAKLLIESGIVDDVDVIIGFHTHPLYETGKIIVKEDELFASGDFFDVVINGIGGHGAYPHQTTDVVQTGVEMINKFNTIIQRNTDACKSAALSVCYSKCGSEDAKNVIPNQFKFGGTIRTLNEEVRKFIIDNMKHIVDGLAKTNKVDACFNLQEMFPILKNDSEVVKKFRSIAVDTVGKDNVIDLNDTDMGCEDFAYFSQWIPSCYFYFGVKNDDKLCNAPFHNPKFDMDEDSMLHVLKCVINFIYKY